MFKKIALATITAAALVAPPSLVHAAGPNGLSLNGIAVNGFPLNGISINGVWQNGDNLNGVSVNSVEPAGREVYFVGERADGENSTVLTIELPQGHVGR